MTLESPMPGRRVQPTAFTLADMQAAITRADKREWTALAKGISVDAEGRVVIPDGSEVSTRVDLAHREAVALWALRMTGRLTRVRRLRIASADHLEVLDGLLGLRELDLSGTWITDLRGVRSLSDLRTLDLTACTELTSLDGVQGLGALETLNLYSCEPFSLAPLADVPSVRRLILRAREHDDWGEFVGARPGTIYLEWQDESGYEVDPDDWDGEEGLFDGRGEDEDEDDEE